MQGAHAEQKVERLEEELKNVKEACKDMHNLLKLKIEKENVQRALWSVEQKAEVCSFSAKVRHEPYSIFA